MRTFRMLQLPLYTPGVRTENQNFELKMQYCWFICFFVDIRAIELWMLELSH